MNTAAIFAFVIEYGAIPLLAYMLVTVGWFIYDETRKVSNKVESE